MVEGAFRRIKMAYQFLDLYDVFVNQVAGSPTMFLVLGIIFILAFTIKFKIDSEVTIGLVAVFIMSISVYISSMLPIMLFIIALLVGSQINRLITR